MQRLTSVGIALLLSVAAGSLLGLRSTLTAGLFSGSLTNTAALAAVLDYVKRVRTKNPRDIVTVFVPEYVVGHWWEQVLHNQSALRLKSALHFTPGVIVASVPWQLQSSIGAEERMGHLLADDAPGDIRKGLAEDPAATPSSSPPSAPSP